MRIRLRTGRTALFLAMLVVALIVFLPLRLVLGWAGLAEQGLTARSVGGTFWEGSIREARFGDVALGDMDAGIAPLPLLLGRARIELASRAAPGAPSITGAVTVSRHAAGLDDANAAIPVGRALAPLPISAIDLTDVSVRFVDGACDRAEGRVRATLAGSALPTPAAMAGPARCDGEALLLPLTGGPGEGANLRLWQDGRYRAELSLPPGQPNDAPRLQAAGFIGDASGWKLAIEGRF
jgi:general secretion pathway protein N